LQELLNPCKGVNQPNKLNALKRLKIIQMETQEIYKTVKLGNSNNLIAIIEQADDKEFFITIFDNFSDYEGGIYIEDSACTQQDAETKANKIIDSIIKKNKL
jgi:hypothetical protein